MSLAERCRRLDFLYLEWDRAHLEWTCDMTEINRRRVLRAWRRYQRLRSSKVGL
jgi:hypothetical protein